MNEFEGIFDNIYRSSNDFSKKRNFGVTRSASKRYTFDSSGGVPSRGPSTTIPINHSDEYGLQEKIRPFFGKSGINQTPIGTPPDFIELEHLSETVINHYICTVFVDIIGSTRLSLLYDLREVFQLKNAVIQACIGIVRAFDGCVHRIMGDAVMAFFGGKNITKEDSVSNAINSCLVLRLFLENEVKPWLTRKGYDAKDFGFRVGCDFGNDRNVLWGRYGHSGVSEVSATGLTVDMASKLQSLAGKNEIMLGQSILDFVDWPMAYTKPKISSKGGQVEENKYVTPNITDNEGYPINYRMKLIDYHRCLRFNAFPVAFRTNIDGTGVQHHQDITYKCYVKESDGWHEYHSASRYLDKNLSLEFYVEVNARGAGGLSFPLKAMFYKTNHGKETPEYERSVEQNAKVKEIRKSSHRDIVKSGV